MKRLIAFFLLFACLSANAVDINAQISVTARAKAGACSFTAVGSAVDAINTSYSTQGVNVRIVPTITDAFFSPPDSSNQSMPLMLAYMTSSVKAWTDRTNASASMGIIVSLPDDTAGQATNGAMSAGVPTKTVDASAAVNCKTLTVLADQLERAISHVLGATSTDGYAARIRSYPYQGDNLCYHTKTGASSDPLTLVPLLGYWAPPYNHLPGDPADSASSSVTCELVRQIAVQAGAPLSGYATASVSGDNGSTASCNIYSSLGVLTTSDPLTHFASSGSDTMTCGAAGDFEISQYSCNGESACTGYLGHPLGDSSHDAVADMNARTTTVGNFKNNNSNLKAAASFATDLMFRFMHLF